METPDLGLNVKKCPYCDEQLNLYIPFRGPGYIIDENGKRIRVGVAHMIIKCPKCGREWTGNLYLEMKEVK